MGQGGSISENKSLILSNWIQIKTNSNIFYNKVTNQHIQRHQVLINDKNQLSSYVSRMQDQSGLICRLIYFHPKSLPKDQTTKKYHSKQCSHQHTQDSNRAKSMLNDQQMHSLQQKSSPKNIHLTPQNQFFTKVYCVYTDRMIPIKQWNKDKIIDTIQGFKKLTKIYGLFKVREHCICENQRKQVKIWINQNPVSNFPIQTVQSQQDMIADLAALLVSRKEKIAKQLLDLQFFDQVIAHLHKIHGYDHKKFIHSTNQSNTASSKPSGFPTTAYRQSQTNHLPPPLHHPPQINNFYNVFINTDNSYTVSSSLQNSKYNIMNKGSFGYPYYSSKNNNQPPPPSKQFEQDENIKKNPSPTAATFKTQNEVIVKHQNSPTLCSLPAPHPTFSQGLVLNSTVHKNQQNNHSNALNLNTQNQVSQNSTNQASHSSIVAKQIKKQLNPPQYKRESQGNELKIEEKQLMENTSIMMHAKNNPLNKNQIYPQKNYHEVKAQKQSSHMMTSEKKPSSSSLTPNTNLYSTQISKNTLVPKFIASSNQQIKNQSKNSSSGDITVKNYLKTEHALIKDNFGNIKKETGSDNNATGGIKGDPKQFFSNNDKPIHYNNYLTPQGMNSFGKHGLPNFKQKVSQMNKKSGEHDIKQGLLKQVFRQIQTKKLHKNELTPTARSQSKIFVKSNYHDSNQNHPQYESNRNVVSQMSTLKPPNLMNPSQSNNSTLNKKSFPKYFHDKQSGKSIHKYYEKSLQQRQKSKAVIGKLQDKISPHKFVKGFGGQTFKYKPSKTKDITQQIVAQVNDSQACSQQIIPPSGQQTIGILNNNNYLKTPTQNYEQRRKFPSTTENKSKKMIDIKQFEQKQFTRSKPNTQIDSQESYINSNEATKSNFMDPAQHNHDKQKVLKKSNNTCFEHIQQKSGIMTQSYFSHMNTNNSLLITHSQYDKQQYNKKIFETDAKKRKQLESMDKQDDQSDGKFRFKDLQRIQVEERTQIISNDNMSGFYKHDQKDSVHFNDTKSRDSIVEIDEYNRNQSFPYQTSVLRKNEKQFTFFNNNSNSSNNPNNNNSNNNNSNKKNVLNIQQIKGYEISSVSKNKVYLKKQSIKSVDEQQTLPRTTADQRQKRMFKQTRTSQVLIQTNQLHSSDPGHKIIDKIQKQKQTLFNNNNNHINNNNNNNQMLSALQQKLDVKQYPKFKKWQPSINVYGSLINQQQSSIKKKDYSKSQQQGLTNNPDDQISQHDSQKQDHDKISNIMVCSQNLQVKKKIRKQVFNDYKGLFGDQNPFQKQQTPQEKQKARKLQVKKKRQQEQRMLENASSKDLLIQQKVQKQKQKHAQLKCDLSKLFTQEM